MRSNSEANPYLFELPTVWVKVKSDGVAFKVTPAENTIDSLKKAIKPNWESMDQAQITILDPDTKTRVQKQSAALRSNSEANPYLFELPTK